ncbi:hypothetical protein GGR52DRAFT_573620 [Hypoxylon sp. FL1284]|nr:hypothetical protein GGR52DRAFT_573620 [Hypoxylon sp. FL1284]
MAGISQFPIEISEDESDLETEDAALVELREDLLDCLDGIQSTGTVAFSESRMSFVNPGLVIGDTLIPLPLVSRDTEILKSMCRLAPFGKGDETVVDTSVRKTWELDYKGSFFKPHKDSEKAPGMIGTLVICLPSKHEGGSVHLPHAGKKYDFDTDKTSEFGLTALSWFSDVTHEIKPLVSGYRLVLT